MLKSDTAEVFLLELQDFEDTFYRQFYEATSTKRRQRADRYLRYEDSLRCVMSEILVKYAYHTLAGASRQHLPQIVYPAGGKPYIDNDSKFHFNISHTGKFVAVGCAGEELGIDIEQTDVLRDIKSMADLVFTSQEREFIFETSKEPAETAGRFTKLWTAKESYLKYLGCGFNKSPLSFSVNLNDKTIVDVASGIVPGITILSSNICTAEHYCLTVCGNFSRLSVHMIADAHTIMDVILR